MSSCDEGEATQQEQTQEECTPTLGDDSIEAQPARLLRVDEGTEVAITGTMSIGRAAKAGKTSCHPARAVVR